MARGKITLHEAHARDVLPEIQPESIDCVIADPPYGVTKFEWDKWPGDFWLPMVRDALRPSGSMWVFGTMATFMERAPLFLSKWRIVQEVIWEKHNGTNFHNDRFRRVHEIALQLIPKGQKWEDTYKNPQYTNDARRRTVRVKDRPSQWMGRTTKVSTYRSEDGGPRLMRSVMYMRSEHGRAVHPTQKPVGLLRPLIEYSCPLLGTVLDPFAGSGSTALACVPDRHAVLIEKEPVFCNIARDRLADFTQPFELKP